MSKEEMNERYMATAKSDGSLSVNWYVENNRLYRRVWKGEEWSLPVEYTNREMAHVMTGIENRLVDIVATKGYTQGYTPSNAAVSGCEAARPTSLVVCLCGSTRFRDEFSEANRRETMAGRIVVAPGVFAHSGDPLTADQKERLDKLHFRKIDMADRVLVVNPGGYIGESTRREIAYAETLGKMVLYTHH